MKLEVEIDHRRSALIRGLAAYHRQSPGRFLSEMLETFITGELDFVGRDMRGGDSPPPPPLRVKIKR